MKDKWMPIVGFPNYEISANGAIRSIRKGSAPLMIKPIYCSGGTYYNLNREGKQYRYPMLRILYAGINKINPERLDGYIFRGSVRDITVTTLSEIAATRKKGKRISREEGVTLCNELISGLLRVMEFYKSGDTSILFDMAEKHHNKVVVRLMNRYGLCKATAEECWTETLFTFIERVTSGYISAACVSFTYLARMAGHFCLLRRKRIKNERCYNDGVLCSISE